MTSIPNAAAMVLLLSVFILLNVLYVLSLMYISLSRNEEENTYNTVKKEKSRCNLTKATERE